MKKIVLVLKTWLKKRWIYFKKDVGIWMLERDWKRYRREVMKFD